MLLSIKFISSFCIFEMLNTLQITMQSKFLDFLLSILLEVFNNYFYGNTKYLQLQNNSIYSKA